MNGIAVLVACAAVGVDYGWQPGVDNQLEYIIQIEPALVRSLESGREIVSEIHPEARGVRRIRVRVGTGTLPRVGGAPANTAPAQYSTSDTNPANSLNVSVPPGSALPAGETALPAGSALTSSGILNLPPPPQLSDLDGKSSVLVRPGDRALPGITPPANTYPPAGSVTPDTGGLSAPGVLPPTGYSGGSSWQSPTTPSVSSDSLTPPPNAGGGFPTQPNSWQGVTPNGFGNPAPVSPVPGLGSGPENGLPSPIHSGGTKPRNQSLIEKMVAKSRAGQGADSEVTNALADNGSDAAAQKPTIDEETAARLQELQAEHPWVPLVLTSLALFGSLAANAYLGWVAVGIYHRYRDMCEQLHEAQASLT